MYGVKGILTTGNQDGPINQCKAMASANNSQFFGMSYGSVCDYGNVTTSLLLSRQLSEIRCSVRCGDYQFMVDGTASDAWTCGSQGIQSLYQLKV